MPTDEAQANASKFKWDCKCTESLSHSTLRKPNNNNVNRKAPETITSTERCGPRFCFIENISYIKNAYIFPINMDFSVRTFRYERTLSQVLIFRTLFKRKCGKLDLRARRDEVNRENSLAYRNLFVIEQLLIICNCK